MKPLFKLTLIKKTPPWIFTKCALKKQKKGFTFCGGHRLTTTLDPNMEKEICKALHVGNTINVVIV
jgi:hypothetical protein